MTDTGHADCADQLRNATELRGIEVAVSTAPPLIRTPYTTDGMTCPHGVTYWIEPTGEQIARWAAEEAGAT